MVEDVNEGRKDEKIRAKCIIPSVCLGGVGIRKEIERVEKVEKMEGQGRKEVSEGA